jgi:hypothetical protein
MGGDLFSHFTFINGFGKAELIFNHGYEPQKQAGRSSLP